MKTLIIFFILPTLCMAEVYVKVDDNGNKIYTNINPSPLLTPHNEEIKNPTSTDKKQVGISKSSALPQLRVTKAEQEGRDKKRFEILTNELSDENNNLEKAIIAKDLKAANAHSRNIKLLEKELGL
jgi:hypothetical protein